MRGTQKLLKGAHRKSYNYSGAFSGPHREGSNWWAQPDKPRLIVEVP